MSMDLLLAGLRDETLWACAPNTLQHKVSILQSHFHAVPDELKEEAVSIIRSRLKARGEVRRVLMFESQNTHRPWVGVLSSYAHTSSASAVLRYIRYLNDQFAQTTEDYAPRAQQVVSCFETVIYGHRATLAVRIGQVKLWDVVADPIVFPLFRDAVECQCDAIGPALRTWSSKIDLLYPRNRDEHPLLPLVPQIFNPYFAEKWGVTIQG